MGLGLRKGMIHLVWNLGWFSRTELTIPSPTIKVNDGSWHSIKINRVRQSLDIEIDGEIYNSRVTGSYYELNTADSVLVGKDFVELQLICKIGVLEIFREKRKEKLSRTALFCAPELLLPVYVKEVKKTKIDADDNVGNKDKNYKNYYKG